MQTASARYLVLAMVLLVGAALYLAMGQPLGAGTPRWPAADGLYTQADWSVGPQNVERATTAQITRLFRSRAGATATLVIFSNQAPKLYGAGAEVPFLGNGYSVEPLPTELLPVRDTGVQGLIAQQGSERWLVLYAYGERRGLLGNGPLPWALAFVDGVLGRPNDYYKLYLSARIDNAPAGFDRGVVQLAMSIFPRIAGFYAA